TGLATATTVGSASASASAKAKAQPQPSTVSSPISTGATGLASTKATCAVVAIGSTATNADASAMGLTTIRAHATQGRAALERHGHGHTAITTSGAVTSLGSCTTNIAHA